MRRHIVFFAFLATLPAAAGAQDKPDFSGTWTLNTEKSDPAPQTGQTGRSRGPGGGMGRPTSLFINQLGSTISIELKTADQSRTVSYYLDGRESHNSGMRGQDFVTKSRWEGASLVTEGENTMPSQMGDVKIKTKEIRTLSDDGKTLTVISTFASPRGEVTRKLVYDKQ
jgi:hypothetical protein